MRLKTALPLVAGALIYLLSGGAANAQCTGILDPGGVCGNPTTSPGPARFSQSLYLRGFVPLYSNAGSILIENSGPQWTFHDTTMNPYESGATQAGGSTTVVHLAHRSCTPDAGGNIPMGCATGDYVGSVITVTKSAVSQLRQVASSTTGTDPTVTICTALNTPTSACSANQAPGALSGSVDATYTYQLGNETYGWWRWVENSNCNYFEVWQGPGNGTTNNSQPLTGGTPFLIQDEFIRVCRVPAGGPPFAGDHVIAFQHNIAGTGASAITLSANYADLHLPQTEQDFYFTALNAGSNIMISLARLHANGSTPSFDFLANYRQLNAAQTGAVQFQVQAGAYAYNWNWPTAAGSSGQPLLSGGGGGSAQTYGTLGVAAGGTGATAAGATAANNIGALAILSNLSDLNNAGTARTNLGLGSAAQQSYTASTWTPTLVGSTGGGPPTYTVQVGSYEQIGRQVTVRFNVVTTALGGVTGNMQIGGLPLTSANTANDLGACNIAVMAGVTLDASYVTLTGDVTPNTAVINLVENGSGQLAQVTAVARFAAATTLIGSCVYHT